MEFYETTHFLCRHDLIEVRISVSRARSILDG